MKNPTGFANLSGFHTLPCSRHTFVTTATTIGLRRVSS